MKYYSAFQGNEILPFAITEDIKQSEICPSQKEKYYVIPLT